MSSSQNELRSETLSQKTANNWALVGHWPIESIILATQKAEIRRIVVQI
jgi:hypothetical protein